MSNCDGFTLLESLLAVALLGIVLAGILPAFVTFLDANTLSQMLADQGMMVFRKRPAFRRPRSTRSTALGLIPQTPWYLFRGTLEATSLSSCCKRITQTFECVCNSTNINQ